MLGPFTTANGAHAPAIYGPQSIVHHHGTSHTGHYTAFVRDTNSGRCRYSDARVSTVTEAEAITSGACVR